MSDTLIAFDIAWIVAVGYMAVFGFSLYLVFINTREG